MELCDRWLATGMVSLPWLDRKLGSVPDGQYFKNSMQEVLLCRTYREKTKLCKLHHSAVFLVFICRSNSMAIYEMCGVLKRYLSSLWRQDGPVTFCTIITNPNTWGFLWLVFLLANRDSANCKICNNILKKTPYLWALQLHLRVPKTKILWQKRKIFLKCLKSLLNVWSSLLAF